MVFVKLKDWDLRNRKELKAKAIAARATMAFTRIRNALVFAFTPPAVIELGMSKGFDFQLLDRGGLGHQALMEAQNQLLGIVAKDPRVTKVRPNSMEDVPEYRIDVDWEKAGALGVPIASIHTHALGGLRQRLCQRLHSGRPGQKGIHPGGCPLPHAAQGSGKTLCPEYTRGRWSPFPPLPPAAGRRVLPN